MFSLCSTEECFSQLCRDLEAWLPFTMDVITFFSAVSGFCVLMDVLRSVTHDYPGRRGTAGNDRIRQISRNFLKQDPEIGSRLWFQLISGRFHYPDLLRSNIPVTRSWRNLQEGDEKRWILQEGDEKRWNLQEGDEKRWILQEGDEKRWILQEYARSHWNMEAVLRPKNFKTFSGDFRPVPGGKALENDRNAPEKIRKFSGRNTAFMFRWLPVYSCRNRPVFFDLGY